MNIPTHEHSAGTPVRSVGEEQLVLRAIEAHRFFYPTVSAEAIMVGLREAGVADNTSIAILAGGPRHITFTLNSDTPYGTCVLDLTAGPIAIDIPAGPYIGLVIDHHQRWIGDLGIPGPDGGRGGRYLLIPPGHTSPLPDGYHVARAHTRKVIVAFRALPRHGDVGAALDALRRIRIHPLASPDAPLGVVDLTFRSFDTTPLSWEATLEYWRRLHAVIDAEPVVGEFRPMYGALARLGIVKGQPFEPDLELHAVLETAAKLALEEMRVAAFASTRPDRIVWRDRRWEWVGLVPDDPNFETPTFLDLDARDRWFFQAIGASPAMFRRTPGGGSLYWLAARDREGALLDGGRTYKLTVPTPVPAQMFWSVTAHDARTRSQVATAQNRAVLSSLVDRFEPGNVDIFIGPVAPPGRERQWIQTTPGTGVFLYFRIYGPESPVFDGRWKPSDLVAIDVGAHETATAIPIAITTPRVVDSDLGQLEFPSGVPTEATAARLYEHLDHVRAVEAYTNALPAVVMGAMREGMHRAGVDDNQVLLFSTLMDARSLFLTGNCDTVYFFSFLDLGDGPVVLDIPPGVLGTIDDMWFRFVTDVGVPGPDRGTGGRYLLVPPGYAGALPEGGFYVARARTEHVFLLGRAFLEDDDPAPAATRIRDGVKIYPYQPGGIGSSVATFLAGAAPFVKPAIPPPTRFVEGSGLAMSTIPPNDSSFFDLLDAVVQLEPASALDPEIAGQFAALGIVKDRPFRPDDRLCRVLANAVRVANGIARTISFRPRASEGFAYYGAGSAWCNTLFVGGYDFTRPPPVVDAAGVHPQPDPNARALSSRIAMFYLAFGITPAMCMRVTGLGSQYLVACVDSDGDPLDGTATYRMTLPPKIPAGLFWSVTLYDNQTRSMLQTEQRFPRAGSQSYPSPAAAASSDGSIALYFGPRRPEGIPASNWIQTTPHLGYFAVLRLYSPLSSFFDRSWRPSEIDRYGNGKSH